MAFVASLTVVASLAYAGTASAASPRNVYGTAAGGAGLYYWPGVANTPINPITGGGPVSIAPPSWAKLRN